MTQLVEKRRRLLRRKLRIRKKISGTSQCPRLSVYKSNRGLSVQIIDDDAGVTLLSVSLLETELAGVKNNIAGAKTLADLLVKRLQEKEIGKVVFDRNGRKYHGVVKTVAESARAAGIRL